jgi:hypothetical protein
VVIGGTLDDGMWVKNLQTRMGDPVVGGIAPVVEVEGFAIAIESGASRIRSDT